MITFLCLFCCSRPSHPSARVCPPGAESLVFVANKLKQPHQLQQLLEELKIGHENLKKKALYHD
jgi:hypothetical protein